MVPGSRTHGSGGTTRLHPHPTMKNHHSSPHRGCRGPACLAFEMYTAGIFAASPSNHSSALPSFFTRKGPPPLAGAAGPGQRAALAATGTHVTPQRAHLPPRALTSPLNGRTRHHGHTCRHGHSRHPSTGTLAATGTHLTPQRTHSPPRALTSRLNGRTRRHDHTRRHGHSRHASTGTLAATGTHVTPPRALTSPLNVHTRRHRRTRFTGS